MTALVTLNSASGLTLESPTSNISHNAAKAASIAYAEASIGVTYKFGIRSDSNNITYIIPTPPELPINANARWLSDVVTISATCSFVQTNISQPIGVQSNENGTYFDSLNVNLPDAGLDITHFPSRESTVSTSRVKLIRLDSDIPVSYRLPPISRSYQSYHFYSLSYGRFLCLGTQPVRW